MAGFIVHDEPAARSRVSGRLSGIKAVSLPTFSVLDEAGRSGARRSPRPFRCSMPHPATVQRKMRGRGLASFADAPVEGRESS